MSRNISPGRALAWIVIITLIVLAVITVAYMLGPKPPEPDPLARFLVLG